MKNYKILISAVAALLVATAVARTISVDSIYCNEGTTVSIPVLIDDVSDAALVMLTVNYDSTIVVFQGATAGDIAVGPEWRPAGLRAVRRAHVLFAQHVHRRQAQALAHVWFRRKSVGRAELVRQREATHPRTRLGIGMVVLEDHLIKGCE